MISKYIKTLFKILGSLLILGVVSFWTLQSSNPSSLTFVVSRKKRETTENETNQKIWEKIKDYFKTFNKIKIQKLNYSYKWNITWGGDIKKELSIDLNIFKSDADRPNYDKLSKKAKETIKQIKIFIVGDQKITPGWWAIENINNGLKGNEITNSDEDNQPQWIKEMKKSISSDSIEIILGKLLENSINDAFNNLKTKFEGVLKIIKDANIEQFTVDGVTYKVNRLLQDSNLNKKGSELTGVAEEQLISLISLNNLMFDEEKFNEIILQEIDKKDEIIDIILKFNKLSQIKKIKIEGTNYQIDQINSNINSESKEKINRFQKQINQLQKQIDTLQKQIDKITLDNEKEINKLQEQIDTLQEQIDKITLDNDPFRTTDNTILEQINILISNSIDKRTLIKACFFEVLNFDWDAKLDEESLKKKFLTHFQETYPSIANSKIEIEKDFKNIIFQKGENNNEINKKLSQLEKYLEKIKNSSIVEKDFWKNIKKDFKNLQSINIQNLQIKDQIYQISKIYEDKNLEKEYDNLPNHVKKIIKTMFEGGITENKLNLFYLNKLNSFFKILEPSLKKFAKIKVNQIKIGTTPYPISDLTANIDIVGSAQTGVALNQLISLYNLDNGNAATTKNKLEDALKKIRNDWLTSITLILTKLRAIKITDGNIDTNAYSWTEIIKPNTIAKIYSNLSLPAKTEFDTLLTNKIDNSKLVFIYEGKIDFLFTNIKSILKKLHTVNIETFDIKTIKTFIEGKKLKKVEKTETYSIKILTANLDKEGSKLTGNAKDELFALYKEKSSNEVFEKLKVCLIKTRNNFQEEIKEILIKFNKIKTNKVRVGEKDYSIKELKKWIKENDVWNTMVGKDDDRFKGYDNMKPETQKEFIDLLANKINVEKLTQVYNNKIRNNWLTEITPILTKLNVIRIPSASIDVKGIKQNFSWLELTKTENLGQKYIDLTEEAKRELNKLLASKIDLLKLTQVYENKIIPFLNAIEEILIEFASVNIETVIIDEKPYPISALTANIEKPISEQTEDALNQLITLFNLGDNGVAVRDKLKIALEKKRDEWLTSIVLILNKLVAIQVTGDDIDLQQGVTQTFTWLELSKKPNEGKKYNDLIENAKDELNQLLASKIHHNELTQVYENKINSFLTSIEPVLQALLNANIETVTLTDDNLYSISVLITNYEKPILEQTEDELKQLITLYNLDSTSSVKPQLDSVLTKTRNDWLTSITPILIKLNAIKITIANIDVKGSKLNFSWLELTKAENLGQKYNDLTKEAKKELNKLLASKINDVKLIQVYENKINLFLTTIKGTLQEFLAVKIENVSIGEENYPISSLTINLDTDGSKQTGEALNQLVSLYNLDNGDTGQTKIKLETALTKIRDTYLQTIKPTLKKIKRNEITIDNKKFLIEELKENIDKPYPEMSPEAQTQVEKLQMENVNEKALNKGLKNSELEEFRLTIQNILDNLVAIGLTKLKWKNENYTLTELTNSENKNKNVYQMSSQAREELKILFTSNFKNEWKKIDTFWESNKVDIEKSLKTILKEKPRLINAGIIILTFKNGENQNAIIDINHYIDPSKKIGNGEQKYQLLKLKDQNIKEIIDQNIDQDFLEKWQIWKNNNKVLKNLQINELEFVDEITEEKININLKLFQEAENKKKPSQINELSTLKELSKTRKISVKKFKNLINTTIKRGSEKILLKKELEQENNQKKLTLGLSIAGGTLVIGGLGFGIAWFLKFRGKS